MALRSTIVNAAVLLSVLPGSGAAQPRSPVSFSRDVAPIIFDRCAVCHRPGNIGPFSLLTYADVRQHATQIVDVTSRRVMPPWQPDPEVNEFIGQRVLSDAEIRLIADWVRDGAVEGDPADLPPLPQWHEGWELGEPDLVVSMPSPYTLTAAGPDVFRTFVLPIPTTEVRYVQAIEFRPGNLRAVHHVNIGVDRTRSSRRLDVADAEPGYVGDMVQDAAYPPGQLLGWTPGQHPRPSPDGAAWRLEPGSDLVAQLHMQPTGKPELVQVSAGLFFTDEEPSRTPLGLRLGSETIDIRPGDPEYVIDDSYVLPVDVEVLAVQPHAHDVARRMTASATLPDGTNLPLISIDRWDFRWQDVYRYVEPLELPAGTTISMQYVYDNSEANVRNPFHPPRRIVWGQNTTDEMGDLWVQLVPSSRDDLARLGSDIDRKRREEDLAAYTKLVAEDPRNPQRHDDLAMLYLDAGETEQAVRHFRESLRLSPDSAATHYNIGLALATGGDLGGAELEFRETLRLDPEHATAHNNLGVTLHVSGRLDEAVESYRQAIVLRPDNTEARANLGRALTVLGHFDEAEQELRQLLAMRPDSLVAQVGLAWVLATSLGSTPGQIAEAVDLAEQATRSGSGDPMAFDTLAAAYAASGDLTRASAVAQRAIELAERVEQRALADQIRMRLRLYEQGIAYRVQGSSRQ